MFASTLIYVFALILMGHAVFASGSWEKTGRKISIVGSNLLFVGVFLYLSCLFWRIDISMLAPSGGHGGWWILRNTPGINPYYLDAGFWTALFGTILSYVAWLKPQFVSLNFGLKTEECGGFKRWFTVSEWEKPTIVATSSFLMIFVFAALYLLLP
jgi:hypothetical protein